MLLETLSMEFRKALATNSTDSNFPSRVPTGTEPTGAGVFNLGFTGLVSQNKALIMPYALGADNDTFSVRVIGWRKVGNDPNTLLWVPYVLGEILATASAVVGVAGRQILNTERFADTITLVAGTNADFVDCNSPTTDAAAFALVDLQGSQKVEFCFKLGTSPTSVNALFALL